MSWAEVKKINSNMMMPLDMQALFNHVDLVGDRYNPLGDINQMLSAMNYDSLYGSNVCTCVFGKAFWDYILNLSTGAGSAIGRAFGISSSSLIACNTWSQVLASTTAVSTLRTSANFFSSMAYVDSATMDTIAGTGQLIGARNTGLVETFRRFPGQMSNQIRDTALATRFINNAVSVGTFFAARTTTTMTLAPDMPKAVLVAVAPGKSAAGAHGGEGGAYTQKVVNLSTNTPLHITISTSETSCSTFGIAMPAGGGAAAATTPDQDTKLIKVSQHGNNGNNGASSNTGGGGGYGGGNGGNGGGGSSSVSGHGGIGSAQLPNVEGTGGSGSGSGSVNKGQAGVGGGGGGGYSSSTRYGGGGGGGYGGGGGGYYGSGGGGASGGGGSGFILLLV